LKKELAMTERRGRKAEGADYTADVDVAEIT
jgi:hypothetical protein